MRFSTSLAVAALSAGAFAQQLQVTDSIGASVLAVLATAIPPESISKATADPAAFSAELDSSLSAGNTPAWYQDLPTDVKSYLPQLYPAAAPATTSAAGYAASSVVPSSSAAVPTPYATISGYPTGGNYSLPTTVSSATLAPTGGANTEAPAEHTGAAAIPAAFVNAGVAGALGIFGMLLL